MALSLSMSNLALVTALAILGSILYKYSVVLPVLAAVSTPLPACVSECPDQNPDLDDEKSPTEPKRPTQQNKEPRPILTDQLTVGQCLKRQHYQGLGITLAYRVGKIILVYYSPLDALNHDNILYSFLYNTVISILLSPLQIALIHVTISSPSSLRFYQPSWVRLAPMVALVSAFSSATFYLPIYLTTRFGRCDSMFVDRQWDAFGITFLLTLFIYFVGLLPARAVFIRLVASSLLHHEPRCGRRGRVRTPHIWNAWASFGWEPCLRFYIIHVASLGLMMMCWFVLVMLGLPLNLFEVVDVNFLA